MKATLLPVVMLMILTNGFSQDCTSTFGKTIGAPIPREGGNCLAIDPENKVIYAGGYTRDSTLLLKMDQDGNIIWSKSIDMLPGTQERVGGMVFDSEGMLCVAGMTDAPEGGLVYLMRFNPQTETMLWANVYVSHSLNYGQGLIEKGPEGPYLMLNVPFDPQNAELLEIDRNTGMINPSFSKHYDYGSADSYHDLYYYEGSLYAVGRFTIGAAQSRMRTVLARLNGTDGQPDWVKLGHKPNNTDARLYGDDIVIDQNSIYATSHGDSDGTDVTNDELFIQKTSLDGTLAWVKHYQLPGKADVDEELIATGDGFVIMGRNRGPSNIFLFKINHNGDVLWAHDYDFATNDNTYFNGGATDQLVSLDGHLYFTAYAEEQGRRDMIVVKTDRDGQIDDACEIVQDIDVVVTTIEDAVFFPIEPTVYSFVPEIIPVETAIVNTPLQIENTCVHSGDKETILNEVICLGDEFEGYTQAGTHTDTFPLNNGCDSIRILNLRLAACDTLVAYDLNACTAYMSNGTNMDYSEFIGSFPTACAPVSATTVHRFPPQPNKHSCTPGLDNTAAMCVGALNSCTYVPGHEASVVFEVTITPEPGSIFQVTGLDFFEKAPLMYDWINGESGPNNYPLQYGLRILKDGTEIYVNPSIATNSTWTLQEFNFLEDSLFEIRTPTVFRFELLPYCLVGNGATEAVWDLENIAVFGGCILLPEAQPVVTGKTLTYLGSPIPGTELHLSLSPDFANYVVAESNGEGQFIFNDLQPNASISLRGHNNHQVLQGVNTHDLIALKQHLLGKKLFSRVEQYVAADINRDGDVNSKDVGALQKTLVGFTTAFPGNTSWRFGQWLSLPTMTYPEAWQEVVNIESLPPGQTTVDFQGIKTGDITGDVRGSQTQLSVSSRTTSAYSLQLNNQEINIGSPVTIDVAIATQVKPEGLQLAWQLNGLELVKVESAAISIGEEDFSVSSTGVLRLAWVNENQVSLTPEETLFRLTFIPSVNGRLKDLLQIRNEILNSEIYIDDQANPLDITYTNPDEGAKRQMVDFTIMPNPFSQNTTIKVSLQADAEVQLSVYDASGREIMMRSGMFKQGENTMILSKNDLGANTGLLYCKLTTPSGFEVKKMFRLD